MKTSVKNLLKKINAGESHRMSHDTYEAVVQGGLAFWDSSARRWQITELGCQAITPFKAQEIAYLLRGNGKPWQRRVVKTQAAFDKLMVKLADQGAEIMLRDAD